MISYNQLIQDTYDNLHSLYNRIYQELNTMDKYQYIGDGEFSPHNPPKQKGVYIMVDNIEKRIVRVGETKKSLYERLSEHFVKEDKDHSILRKHIGRAILNKQGNSLTLWETKGTTDITIEQQVSNYLKDNISFYVIPLSDLTEIRELEKFLIKILSRHNTLHNYVTNNTIQSGNWLGNHGTDKIKKSGLWNDDFVRDWKE